MAFKLIIFTCLLAFASAGLIPQPAAYVSHGPLAYAAPAPAFYSNPSIAVHSPTITSQSSNILRSAGNLGQISHESKTIDTPYSSVSRSDVRVSNPGLLGVAYSAAPLVSHFSYDAPLIHYTF